MKAVAVKEGVQVEKLVIEQRATSTYESATNCIKIMRSHNWSTAIVVSDKYHIFRSVILFRLLGVSAFGSGVPGGRGSNSMLKWAYYHIREIVAIPWCLGLVLMDKLAEKTH